MAIKELKTRIALRTGDYAYWTTGAGKDIELYKGEVCVCTVATADNQATNAPTVLFKVANANGQKFADLNWVSGLAADVYAWAKKENPDWTDFPALPLEVVDPDAATKKFITGISYANNKLTITRSDVDWTDVKNAPDFALKSELPTELGVMSVANADDTIVVGGDGKDVTLKVADNKFDAYGAAKDLKDDLLDGTIVVKDADNATEAAHAGSADSATHADGAGKVDYALTVKVGGADVIYDGFAAKTADVDTAIKNAIDAIPEVVHPEYSIVKDATSEYAATYHLTKDGVNVGAAINIPKDLVVESGKVETLEAGVWGEAGTYIILTLANATNDKIYVNVGSLIEYVTSGSTADSQVIIDIDANHKVTATIGAGKVTATELAKEIKDDIAKGVEAQGWGNHANAGYAKAGDLHIVATSGQYGDLEGRPTLGALAAKDNITHDLVTDFDAAVKAVKVDAAVDADKLGGVVAADYLKKSEAEGYADILTKTAAQGIYQPKGNYATADQGNKADSALQEIEAGTGLKVSEKKDNKQTIDIDEEVIFILNANF
jgi:hypothetical protein